jgi:hypothetical protein
MFKCDVLVIYMNINPFIKLLTLNLDLGPDPEFDPDSHLMKADQKDWFFFG